MEEWYSEELIEFVQLMIFWLIMGSQEDSCVIPLQISAMSRGCSTSYRLAWDLGDFTTYKQSERGLHGGTLWMICWEIWESV
jgi:hypothetical protein